MNPTVPAQELTQYRYRGSRESGKSDAVGQHRTQVGATRTRSLDNGVTRCQLNQDTP